MYIIYNLQIIYNIAMQKNIKSKQCCLIHKHDSYEWFFWWIRKKKEKKTFCQSIVEYSYKEVKSIN